MEYQSLSEIHKNADTIKGAIATLLSSHAIVGRRNALQWRFFEALVQRLLANRNVSSEFDEMSRPQTAQLKFEVEDKLKRYYLRPGNPVDFVFTLLHRNKLRKYLFDSAETYPSVAGYCLMVRDLRIDSSKTSRPTLTDIKLYLERVCSEANDAEFRAYASLPDIQADELRKWFYPDSPALKEILNVLERHKEKEWIISNRFNPSTKRLVDVRIKQVEDNEATLTTTEYWYLRWWSLIEKSYVYSYRETNYQLYLIKRDVDGSWKVFQNLRPLPRTSIAYQRSRRHKVY